MKNSFLLKIVTPFGIYLSEEVEYLSVQAPHSVLGILPNHAELISTVLLSEMKIRIHGTYFYYAISDGVLHVKKDETVLLLNSIERSDEIDVDRANKAKERAEQRLLRKYDDDEVDVIRAESALKRALNRIKVATKL